MNNYSPSFARFLAIVRSPFFALFIVAFCSFSYFYLDKDIAIFIKHHFHHNLRFIGEMLTQLGKGNAYFIALPLLILLFKFVLKNREWTWKCLFLLLAIATPGAVVLILKSILGRARPTLLFSDDLYGFSFFHVHAAYLSFPSGHSVLITGLMLGLAFIFSRYWLAFIIIALLVSSSRIVVGAHYLSDVIAGIYLSVLLVPWLHDKLCSYYLLRRSVPESTPPPSP